MIRLRFIYALLLISSFAQEGCSRTASINQTSKSWSGKSRAPNPKGLTYNQAGSNPHAQLRYQLASSCRQFAMNEERFWCLSVRRTLNSNSWKEPNTLDTNSREANIRFENLHEITATKDCVRFNGELSCSIWVESREEALQIRDALRAYLEHRAKTNAVR